MPLPDRIDVNPDVMLGKPVIRGTRITVELILRDLAHGASATDLLRRYPLLTLEDITAAITYGADTVAHAQEAHKGAAQPTTSEEMRGRLKQREPYRGATSPTDVVREERDGR